MKQHKLQKRGFSFIVLFFSLIGVLSGCRNPLGDSPTSEPNFSPGLSSSNSTFTVTSVNVSNNQLTLSGTNLDSVTGVNIEGISGFDIVSKSPSSVVAAAHSNTQFALGLAYQLLVSTAGATSPTTITFTIPNGSIIPAMLDRAYMTASGGAFTGPLVLPSNGLTVGSNQLVVTGGNVGIGTTAPTQRLDINGSVNISTGSSIMTNGSPILSSQGTSNLIVGATAMHFLSNTGGQNVSVGTSSMELATTGGQNASIGYRAMYSLVGGDSNTAVGNSASYSNVSGRWNVAVGRDALVSATGDANIALGKGSGSNITTGYGNIIIGTNTAASSPTGNNQLNIGNAIYGNLANGNIGLGTASPQATLDVNGYARLKSYGSPPVSCTSTYAGSIALNSNYTGCVCNGSIWIKLSDASACAW